MFRGELEGGIRAEAAIGGAVIHLIQEDAGRIVQVQVRIGQGAEPGYLATDPKL